MGLGGIVKCLLKQLLFIFLAALIIIFVPNLPPNAKISEPYTVTPPIPLEGKLTLNNKLGDVEKWHDQEIFGPEALASYNGELYTSLHGGDIVKLTGNHITPIIKFGKPCKAIHEEKLCGRPLGLKFDAHGNLYAVDAYYGIFKVNVKTGEKLKLIDINVEIGGRKPRLPNSLDIASNGDIYWTDSSSEFDLQDGVFDMLADGSGRLIHYDAKTKKNTVLVDNLHFANGIVLSDDEQFALVTESARSRIIKYHLSGPKKGTHEVFLDGLPGIPDNIQQDGQGGFLVPLIVSVDQDHPTPSQILGPFPLIRKLISRLFALVELVFKTVNRYYPSEFAARGEHFVGHFSTTVMLSPSRTTILQVSKNGEILSSIHSTDKNIGGFSEAYIMKDTLYLGSPFNKYIGRIPLSKVGWEHLQEKAKPTPKPQTTTQAPTTKPPPTQTTTTKPPTQAPTTTTPKPVTKPPPTQAPTPKPTNPPQVQAKQAVPQQQSPPPKPATPAPKPAAQQQTQPPKPATQQQTQPPKPAAQQQTQTPKPAAQQQTQPPKPATQEKAPPKPQTPPPTPAAKQTPPPTQKPTTKP